MGTKIWVNLMVGCLAAPSHFLNKCWLIVTSQWPSFQGWGNFTRHYNDIIMGAVASKITSLRIVYSTVYSDVDQRKKSKPRVTGLCAVNSPGIGEFPAQMASNAENVSIWLRHHEIHQSSIAKIWLEDHSSETSFKSASCQCVKYDINTLWFYF